MNVDVPEEYREDVLKAYTYLISEGCSDIFLFGSIAEQSQHPFSDIDLAVKGLKKDRFFHIYGELLIILNHPVDLDAVVYDSDFSREII
ncbi:MAG: nucleotidyltransferase domain-containing protein, partial [Spirochaetaceae bacterium]|nr:nucleotidyltransferase domain-containing protein [Spirochaetaceae bacterium]